ncbi:MAG: helix-turn-helix transcriptional regulator [Campylobacterales bacterium]|nr:helix-turn-helix transcriptional regulator [Campylobacterales bacterium]
MKNIEYRVEDFLFGSTKEISKALAERVKTFRKQKKMTQEKFAEHIAIPFGTYKEFETNHKISLENFIKVCRGLERVEDLFYLLKPKGIEEVGIAQWNFK